MQTHINSEYEAGDFLESDSMQCIENIFRLYISLNKLLNVSHIQTDAISQDIPIYIQTLFRSPSLIAMGTWSKINSPSLLSARSVHLPSLNTHHTVWDFSY